MRRQHGFTLMELVVVIALLGIVAGISTQFFVNMASGYAGMARRHDLATTVQLGVEKIARELRLALPNSVRINGNCIEFIPVVGATRYTAEPVGQVNQLNLVQLPVPGLTAPPNPLYLSIISQAGVPNPAASLYTLANNTMLTQLSNAGRLNVVGSHLNIPFGAFNAALNAPHTFDGNAGGSNRVYFTGQPVSYCRVGNDLYRYQNYGFIAAQPSPPNPNAEPNRTLLATGLSTVNPPFYSTIGGGGNNFLLRSSLILIDLEVTEAGERVQIQQLVQVRNG
ncbi:PulJ/GspJ family protein [Marinobacterium jannaschii]|uniref:PulJ/GspJ family protein n=1 Tax=Marinobacterium jannaschii TaxID=64970 RepID=UPI000487458A|nr:prepilin-type N-terminal cleavage/methylation domain-containing protein [Marinobacterium jannaschii]